MIVMSPPLIIIEAVEITTDVMASAHSQSACWIYPKIGRFLISPVNEVSIVIWLANNEQAQHRNENGAPQMAVNPK
jgi:hypothetical protein